MGRTANCHVEMVFVSCTYPFSPLQAQAPVPPWGRNVPLPAVPASAVWVAEDESSAFRTCLDCLGQVHGARGFEPQPMASNMTFQPEPHSLLVISPGNGTTEIPHAGGFSLARR